MEDLDITSSGESSESGWVSPEGILEKSEKQKESYKKAQAQIQRSQKDEKKAKWDNNDLFDILSRCINNPYYETLIPVVTDILSITMPSRPIIGLLVLVYPEAAHHVFHTIKHPEHIHMMQWLHRYDEPWVFHEKDLHISLREWMSTWIESFDTYVVMDDSSIIMQKKFFAMIDSSEDIILWAITEFVLFFFQSRNIVISRDTTTAYSKFILRNIRTNLQKSILAHPDGDMALDEIRIDMNLFGI